jgi:hypothetical protein
MSKVNRQIIPIEDVKFDRLKFEEVKESEYSKYMLMSFANYEQQDGTITSLYMKTPLMDYVLGGLPPAKDKDGNELFKDDSERAKWRCYLGNSPNEKKMYEKMVEFQDKLIKDKAIIVGKKDEKKFELENIIGETMNKEGEPMYYVRFNFRTEGPTHQIGTKFFVRKDGIDEEVAIKSVSDFESQFRRGEFRYRMIISLSKIWKQKKATGKYGASFKVEQMLIEMRDDIASLNVKNMFAKSQFDSEENITSKMGEVDLYKNIENTVDDEDDVEEDTKEKVGQDDEEQPDEEEDDDEIKPTKKSAAISVKKTVRRKGAASS